MRFRRIAFYLLAAYLTGCKTPSVPPETRLADQQERDLWRAGASVYAPREYESYLGDVKRARQALAKESLKLGWFREYIPLRDDFRRTLVAGDALLARTLKDKEEKSDRIREEVRVLRKRIGTLNDITLALNERGRARGSLTQAGIMLQEVSLMADGAKYDEALDKLRSVRDVIKEAESTCLKFLSRYQDSGQIEKWRRLAEETVQESRAKGSTALLVIKLEKRMIVYKKGVAVAEYDVGLGFNGLSDKRHSGDDATPEGRYKITKKNPASRFYKALLINYPNDEDRQRFAVAKQRREIPYWVGIGGLVEIHGGGEDGLTRGCVSVDDKVMDELFGTVSVGTPVTIVGTLDKESPIVKAIRDD
ncbi:MAG TPA: L,D-transpeptidase [Acidobacteriota bacterium]|nr:L,D-transpeptidase [Acidobacteriota bacterium]